MQFRMSPTTFFMLTTQALLPEFSRVLFYNRVGSIAPVGYLFLNAPVIFDSTVPKGQIVIEPYAVKADTAAPGAAA